MESPQLNDNGAIPPSPNSGSRAGRFVQLEVEKGTKNPKCTVYFRIDDIQSLVIKEEAGIELVEVTAVVGGALTKFTIREYELVNAPAIPKPIPTMDHIAKAALLKTFGVDGAVKVPIDNLRNEAEAAAGVRRNILLRVQMH